tara:strand:+ start:1842 stop:2426 length:585 start_codon:yes stop_codon:yes gene_type:complete
MTLNKILEDPNGINEADLLIIESKFSGMPFTYRMSTSPSFPYYQHPLVERNEKIDETIPVEPCSDAFPFFWTIMHNFMEKWDLKYRSIIRGCINNTYHLPFEYGDPHVDAKVPHYVLIMYLNNASGNTVVFDETYPENDKGMYLQSQQGKHFTIKKEITPQRGKIAVFNGKHYHTNRCTGIGEHRSICIFNLLA